jgi:isopentenyl diphosphate isomerase/L-lactate dehydrogenase-like FMN-dependent dehydrogenase
LEALHQELDLAMALAGCRTVDDVTRDLVQPHFSRAQ